ncbi:hypothetical protein V6N13_035591 [Hibiscus sabdariffa]
MAGSCLLLQSQIKRLSRDTDERKSVNSSLGKKGLSAGLGIELEKQLQDWRENPTWLNQSPEIKMKFKQVNTGFMKKFEGHWRVEPVFVDEETCFPFKPKTWAEYYQQYHRDADP